jgi:hypothetical protein
MYDKEQDFLFNLSYRMQAEQAVQDSMRKGIDARMCFWYFMQS